MSSTDESKPVDDATIEDIKKLIDVGSTPQIDQSKIMSWAQRGDTKEDLEKVVEARDNEPKPSKGQAKRYYVRVVYQNNEEDSPGALAYWVHYDVAEKGMQKLMENDQDKSTCWGT